MEYIDVAIIGGGPAGLMAAISAAGKLRSFKSRSEYPENPRHPAGVKRVVVFEKGPRPGRKLLASGSGRCNLTHEGDISAFLGHYGGGERPPGNPAADGSRSPGSGGRFLRAALYGFDSTALRQWLGTRGLDTKAEENGKIFPVSGKAGEVLDLLLRELEALGVEVRLRCGVESLVPHSGGFILSSGPSSWGARTVILAAGGHSYPDLGSDGDSWRLASGLGHEIVDPGPALAPVSIKPFSYPDCAGISLPDRTLGIRRYGKLMARGFGAVLFTHEGLSGPGILDSSRWMRPGDELVLPLGPFGAPDQADTALREACAAYPGKQVRSLLAEWVPKRLAEVLLGLAACPGETRAAQLTKACRTRLAEGLGGEVFLVKGLGGLEVAMASRGGIRLDEVDPKTLMSHLVPGFFCVGEALDVDGDTGGYNLQAAFSTGRLAGLKAAEFLDSGRVPGGGL